MLSLARRLAGPLGLLNRLADAGHPLWSCGTRPFFLATAAAGPLLMLPWALFLAAGTPLPPSAGGPLAWHAHELLSGLALASVLGFLLTAVPEFTAGTDFSPRTVRRLFVLWLAARVAYWSSGWGGTPVLALSLLLHLGLLAALLALLWPRLWRDPERRHLSFAWVLLVLAGCEAMHHAELLRGSGQAARWLQAMLGVYMVLVVVALSRISMRIVNEAVDAVGGSEPYLARPPRRHFAVVAIAAFTLAELALPQSRVSGWLALAAAAAVFHLMNDWHVGRALLQRRPLMLYAVYACMGLGYSVTGAGLAGLPRADAAWASAGRHLLAVGALGLAMLGAMVIAGRAHCGLAPDERAWVPAAVLALLLAAAVRATPTLAGADAALAWSIAALAWCLAFGLYLIRLLPVLAAARGDGAAGCRAAEA